MQTCPRHGTRGLDHTGAAPSAGMQVRHSTACGNTSYLTRDEVRGDLGKQNQKRREKKEKKKSVKTLAEKLL